MIIKKITKLFEQAYKNLNIDIMPKIILSNREDLCDYQCDDAFKLAKVLHKSPIDIGNMIIDEISKNLASKSVIERIEVYTPGFINIRICAMLINDTLNSLTAPHFGIPEEKQKTVFFDYGGPNVAKPLHVGHSRSPIIGDALKRMYTYAGYTTKSDVHLGDSGLQIGQVLYGIFRDNKQLDEIDLEYLDKIYPEMSGLCKVDEEIKNKCEELTYKLQKGDTKLEEYYNTIKKVSVNEIKRVFDLLGITFDTWEGEFSSLKYVDAVEQKLNEKGLLQISQGATIVEISTDEDKKPLPPLLFKKSNGACIYATTDLASIEQRVQDYTPDKFIYVADLRQALHFEQVFRTVKKADLSKAEFTFCGFGTVNGKDGKPFKTRTGNTPKLVDLLNDIKENFISLKPENAQMSDDDLNKIVVGILKFADLQNYREKDYIFDIEHFSKVVGKTGPYIMYTYLRLNKIILNNEIKPFNNTIYNEFDRNLRIKLLNIKSVFTSALKENAPDVIANYLYDVCVLSNGFYEHNRVNDSANEIKEQWISLLIFANKVITEFSSLLGLEMPTRM